MNTPPESYLPQSGSQSLKEGTNTLVVASLPSSYFHPTVLRIIQGYFLQFGELYSFAPVPSFKRIIVVFYDDDAAEEAKLCLNGKVLGDDGRAVLKVYRGAPTPLPNPDEDDSFRYLAPPVPEKNFLISPPGSPPEGWEQIKEDPPNEAPLADDLLAALRRLQEEQELRGGGGHRRTEDGRGEILWHASETPAGVGVCVETCDDEEDDNIEVVEEPRWSYDLNVFPSYSSSMKTSSSVKTSFLNKQSISSKVPFPRTALPPRI